MSTPRSSAAARPLLLLAAMAMLACSSLAEDPPEGRSTCGPLPKDALLPPSARPVLNMSAEGEWHFTCVCSCTEMDSAACRTSSSSPCDANEPGWQHTYMRKVFAPDDGGSYANLTGGGYQGLGWWTGLDAQLLLWPEGGTESDALALLTMPLDRLTEFDGGVGHYDLRYEVTPFPGGTIGSDQAELPLPPIYLVVRSTEEEEPAPMPGAPCTPDPTDEWNALSFGWAASYTFYTC